MRDAGGVRVVEGEGDAQHDLRQERLRVRVHVAAPVLVRVVEVLAEPVVVDDIAGTLRAEGDRQNEEGRRERLVRTDLHLDDAEVETELGLGGGRPADDRKGEVECAPVECRASALSRRGRARAEREEREDARVARVVGVLLEGVLPAAEDLDAGPNGRILVNLLRNVVGGEELLGDGEDAVERVRDEGLAAGEGKASASSERRQGADVGRTSRSPRS